MLIQITGHWSSLTSDSASTQKRLNKLIEENRKSDEQRFGLATCTVETLDLIETFCSMHLGVNLRKAFLNGTMETEQDERYHRVDAFVVNYSGKLEVQSMTVVFFPFLTF